MLLADFDDHKDVEEYIPNEEAIEGPKWYLDIVGIVSWRSRDIPSKCNEDVKSVLEYCRESRSFDCGVKHLIS